MKKQILILVLALMIGKEAHSQDKGGGDTLKNLNTVYFDLDVAMPKSGSFQRVSQRRAGRKRLAVDHNDLVVFRIKNYNPLRYEYEINENLINMNYDPVIAAKFQQSKFIEQQANSSGQENKETDNEIDEVKKLVTQLKTEVENIDKAKFSAKGQQKLKSFGEVVTSAAAAIEKTDIEEAKSKISDAKDLVGEEGTEVGTSWYTDAALVSYDMERKNLIKKIKTIDELQEQLTELETKRDIVNKEVTETLKRVQLAMNNHQRTLEGISLMHDKLYLQQHIVYSDDLKKDIDSAFDNLMEIKFGDDNVRGIGHTLTELKGNKLLTEENKERIATFSKTYDLSELEKLIANMEVKVLQLSSLNTSLTSLPYTIKGKNADFLRYELVVRDKATKASLSKHKYDIYIRGGLKIDFSTGLMLTWLTDYNYTTLDTASMKQILRKNEGRIQFLVSTLVNVSYRLGEVINPTLSVGMGLSTEQRFQLLVGGGFSLSKFPRLVVTGGIAFGPVKRLQRPYIENGIYDIQTEAPTEQKFSYNVFAGITYNLTKVKTANAEETNY